MSRSQTQIPALPWRRLWTMLGALLISLGIALVVRAESTSYIGTTMLVSNGMTGGSEGADAIANYASVSWYNEDCDSSQSRDIPYNPLCNSDVLGTPPLVAFASRATNLVQDPPKEQDDCEANIFCANIFLARKEWHYVYDDYDFYVQALTLGGDFTQYPKGDAMFPTLSRDGKFVVFQSASEYSEVEGGDETPETDIWLIDLRPEQEDRNPYLVSNFNTSTGNDVNADSGNVRCRLDSQDKPDCETYSNGTTKPQVEYPHPVADVYWKTDQSGGEPDIYHDVFVAFESLASNLAENDLNGHTKDIFLGQPSDKGHQSNQYPRSEGSLLLTRAPECDSQSPGSIYVNPTNGDSYHPVFVDVPGKNQDGRYLLFVSRATNLICGLNDQDYQSDDPNAHWLERRANIFLLDRDYDGNGTYDEFDQAGGVHIWLVSAAPDGKPANGTTEYPAVAYVEEEGDPYLYITFQSRASNLAPVNLPQGKTKDDNGVSDIYLFKMRLDDKTITERYLVSVPSVPLGETQPAALANLPSYAPSISRDGLLISFTSYATNLIVGDTNENCDYTGGTGIEGIPTRNCPDIFGHDWSAKQTWRISLTSNGHQSDDDSFYSVLSATGQFAYFTSDASLDEDISTRKNVTQIYLRDQGNPPGNPNVQPTFWDWGTLHINEAGASQTFTVRFLGELSVSDAKLQVTSAETPPETFTFTHTCNLEPNVYTRGGSCTFTVEFEGGDAPDKEYTGEVLLSVKRPSTSPRTVRIGVKARTAFYAPVTVDEVSNLEGQGSPGSTVVYTFQVYNNGDLSEDLVASKVNDEADWVNAITAPQTLEDMMPGAEHARPVQVFVQIPAGAAVGSDHQDTVQVCSSHDTSACWQVTLKTTVMDYKVFIPAVMR